MSTDPGMFDDAEVIFFAEARDMLNQIESSLLILESNPNDRETINSLFRAAHTIKGSAGLFGMERVVRFTHQVESVLDRVRNGEVHIDSQLSDVLLQCSDLLETLLTQAEKKLCAPEVLAELDRNAVAMCTRLGRFLGGGGAQTPPGAAAWTAPPLPHPERAPGPVAGTWHLSLRFGNNTFRNGFDPLTLVRYLRSLGEIVTILVVDSNIPRLESLDSESCHLGFEIRLHTTATKVEIEESFEFVRDDCTVRMFPPNRRASDFLDLLKELPDESGLADMLVNSGSITRQALDNALAYQNDPGAGRRADRRGNRSGDLGADRGEDPDGGRDGGQAPTGPQLKAAPKTAAAPPVEAGPALARPSLLREPKSEESRFVRVPADKLDDLINLVGELVICGASASLLASNVHEPQLIETTQQMSGLIEEIRNGTLGLRMVQIGETFARYRRVVRDTSAELEKEIHLEIEGAETELDKSVVEKIGDPLMHLVRNAMDHGIELPRVRLEAGKPAHGTLRMSAHHDSGNIVIRVTDDGKGLDGDRLLAKARERGIVAANQTLTESEKLDLIFEPGFSTAEKVTNLSGRGVGMDVVKKNIEALRGNVLLRSTVGVGTTVEIRLPLTLAIIDGFLVRNGRSSYVIPLNAVVECIDAQNGCLLSNGDWSGNLDLRGEVLSYIDLRKIFRVSEAPQARRSIVVVKSGTSHAGVVVDQLLGEYQTVIKPLGKLFQQLRGISGSTVLGSGEVALILDVPALVRLATERERKEQETRIPTPQTNKEFS